MPKYKVKTQIKNNEEICDYTTTAVINNEKIIYTEKDKTKVLYDFKNNELIRDNNKLRLKYKFDLNSKTEGSILIKDLDKVLNVYIKTNKLINKKNIIEINYTLDKDQFEYKIEVIE